MASATAAIVYFRQIYMYLYGESEGIFYYFAIFKDNNTENKTGTQKTDDQKKRKEMKNKVRKWKIASVHWKEIDEEKEAVIAKGKKNHMTVMCFMIRWIFFLLLFSLSFFSLLNHIVLAFHCMRYILCDVTRYEFCCYFLRFYFFKYFSFAFFLKKNNCILFRQRYDKIKRKMNFIQRMKWEKV